MKTLFCIVIAGILSLIGISLYAQSYKKEGNTFIQQPRNASRQPVKETPYKYSDTKGNVYTIYITASGTCFINKISKNSGKEYRYYLDAEISKEVAKAMGIEYKPKVKADK